MKSYSNAKKGIKKAFWAAILMLVSQLVYSIIGTSSVAGKMTVLLYSIIILLSAIVQIVAYVISLVGLKQAGRDNKYLQNAFVISIVALVTTVISSILSFVAISEEVMRIIAMSVSLLVDMFEIGIVICVCLGTSQMLEEREEKKLASKGTVTAWLFSISFAISIIMSYVTVLYNNLVTEQGLVGGILILVAVVIYIALNLVAYIKYFTFLARSINKLSD